jgi:hypothetical protein
MNINLLFETILVLFAILASNGIIYSLRFFNTKNSSWKYGLPLTSLIASNPLRLTSSESSSSQTLSTTSSESNVTQTLSTTSSESNVTQDILDFIAFIDSDVSEGTPVSNSRRYFSSTNEEIFPSDVLSNLPSLDSLTILDSQTLEQWREIAMDLHQFPTNTPPGILQQIKFEELNILYSKDIIEYAITQTELRLIIEHLPAVSLFCSDINHLILIIMSYYHC